MGIKQIRLSLLILAGLIIASFGFLIRAQEGFSTETVLSPPDSAVSASTPADDSSPNLTKSVAKKLSGIASSTDPDDQQISVGNLQELINAALSEKFSESDLPEIQTDKIKIKEQNYKGSASKIKDQKKEDFINYIAAVYYIFSSNAPEPITSNKDVTGVFGDMILNIISAISTRNGQQLDDIQLSGKKIMAQMEDIEVPEELIDLHIKGLEFAQYSINIKSVIDMNASDPLLDLANLAKLSSFVESLYAFFDEIQAKFTSYGVEYDEVVVEKIKSLGAPAPDPEELEEEAAKLEAIESLETDTDADENADAADIIQNNITN